MPVRPALYLPLVLALAGCEPLGPVHAPDVRYARELVEAHNATRASHGRPPLAWEPHLQAAAEGFARELARRHTLSHTGADGSTCWSRIAAAGYPGTYAGENAALGQRDVAEAMRSWEGSPGHRANLLGHYSDIGAAAVADESGRLYWVVDFAGSGPVGSGAGATAPVRPIVETSPGASSVRMRDEP